MVEVDLEILFYQEFMCVTLLQFFIFRKFYFMILCKLSAICKF